MRNGATRGFLSRFERELYLVWNFSFKFKTGNAENPSDQLSDASVLVAVAGNASSVITRPMNVKVESESSYLTVKKFNNMGFVQGGIDSSLGPIAELRLLVHSDSPNWVVLSEVSRPVQE